MKIVLLIFANCIIFQMHANELFVLGTYDTGNTLYLTWTRDTLFLNTIRSSWIGSQDSIEDYLSFAMRKGVSVILNDAGANGASRLSRFYYIYHKLWESESSYVFHNTGRKVKDYAAANGFAWSCNIHSDPPGVMQHGPSGWQAKIQTHHIRPIYIAQFRLKINKEPGNSTVKVCSLVVSVRRKKELILKADTVLQVRDFPGVNKYGLFKLNFTKDRLDWDDYEYRIWWYGRVNLWSDYVEVKDEHADMLFDGMYDDSLDIIFSSYQHFPALSYFYLKDEPFYGHFGSSQYLMSYINKHYKRTPGIQALGAQGEKYFAEYVRVVNPSVLMFDKYPIRDYIPKSGPVFQKALDGLCEQLSDMRTVALAETLDFWFIVQAFGRYESPYSDEGGFARKWRLPTPQELRCMTWLALAYGAKGIFYYCFKSRIEDNYYLRGLWRFDNTPREPLFSEVKSLNRVLESIGPALLTLTSNSVFRSDSVLPICFINYIKTGNNVQVGTFHNSINDTFFIVVNRHCQPSYVDEIMMGIRGDNLFLEDLCSRNLIPADSQQNGTSYFSILLAPGEGRLFQLIR